MSVCSSTHGQSAISNSISIQHSAFINQQF
jgi:hypothetical protein